MRTREIPLSVSAATAASATTAALATTFKGGLLRGAELLVIDAKIDAPTAGTLDVCLQRKIAANTWRDWIRFAQVAANGVKYYALAIDGTGASIVETGNSTDGSPAMALAAGTAINVMPGDEVRIVCTTGAGTADAGAVDITITPYTERKG